jgi:hypothetical protein
LPGWSLVLRDNKHVRSDSLMIGVKMIDLVPMILRLDDICFIFLAVHSLPFQGSFDGF